jgi:16S rRNA U516 pseudouridylate synthase RsuA-like enzyme
MEKYEKHIDLDLEALGRIPDFISEAQKYSDKAFTQLIAQGASHINESIVTKRVDIQDELDAVTVDIDYIPIWGLD